MVAADDGKAHPRVSGENWHTLIIDEASGGSSPRERGKHFNGTLKDHFERLIPA